MKTTNRILLAALMGAASLGAQALTLAELNDIYLIGNATPADWTNTCAYPLTKTADGVFVYEGGLMTGEFKFLTQLGEWTPAVMPFNAGTAVGTEGLANCDIYVSESGNPDNKWNVTAEGNYRFTIDPTKETLVAEYLGEMPRLIYAQGGATQKGNGNALFMSQQADGKYVWEGIMTYSDEDKLIKFALERSEDWAHMTFIVPESVDYNGNVKLVADGGTYKAMKSAETEPGALKDWFWGIEKGKDGVYRFTVDPEALTVEVKRVKGLPGEFDPAAVTTLYMNGLATDSFNSDEPGAEMTAKGNGVFEWTGNMDYTTDDGDANHANKQFKFLTSKGAWNAVWYLVPAAAQADGYIEPVESGKSYQLAACSWIGGRQGVDAFFGLTPGAKDEYTVKVDVPNMTMTIIGKQTGAVSTVAVDEETVLGVYTLDGRVADIDNLAAGIYVVRTDKGARKIVKK